jgi:hypothetical protein
VRVKRGKVKSFKAVAERKRKLMHENITSYVEKSVSLNQILF